MMCHLPYDTMRLHVSHPIIDLQQRAKMTGGQMGAV